MTVHLSIAIFVFEHMLNNNFKINWNINAAEKNNPQKFQSTYYLILLITVFIYKFAFSLSAILSVELELDILSYKYLVENNTKYL